MTIQDFDQALPTPREGGQQEGKQAGSSTTRPAPSPADSFPALFPIVLGGAFVLGLALAFLILWLTRRRRRRRRCASRRPASRAATRDDVGDEAVLLSASSSEADRSSEETRVGGGGKGQGMVGLGRGGRKLQKACSVGGVGGGAWPMSKEGFGKDGDGEGRGWPRRHVSMPLIPRACSKGHFHFGLGGGAEGCKWPGQEKQEKRGVEMEEVKVCRGKASWIDEDALHGPKISGGGGEGEGRKKKRNRGSWPLRYRAPTLPRVHHTVHGYPYTMSGGRNGSSSEALLGDGQQKTMSGGMGYAQLRAFSGTLLEMPKPALVTNRDRRVVRPSVTMGYVYGASRIPQPIISPPSSPIRSSPTTPLRHRGRQQSTDSTLSDILKSTEKRLREGRVSETTRSRRATVSPTRTTPGKVLGPREFGVVVTRSRTPSPSKSISGQLVTTGHERHDSQKSISSGTDSLAGEDGAIPDLPSGLTSPSRNMKKQESETAVLQTQSGRSSLSSELSTLYSEDEMPDEVKRAVMPLQGLVVQPQQAATVRPPSVNDPFVMAPLSLPSSRASSAGAWPTRHSKSQDLLRQSMQRSQRLRSMTVGHTRAQSQGLILAPGPVIQGPRPLVLPPSRKVSVTIPKSIQPYITSRASEPPPSPTRQSPTTQSPTGPLFLRVTKTSTLSTIPLLPPPSAPALNVLKDIQSKQPSPNKTTQPPTDQTQTQQRRSPVLLLPSTERASAPSSPTRRVGGEMRLSLILPPKPLEDHSRASAHNRASASSSVYSPHRDQDHAPISAVTQTARIELNRAGFQANSSLYPAPLSAHSNRAPSRGRSKLSGELCDDGTRESDEEVGSGGGEEEEDEGDDDDVPLAVTCTIASLRRMNSGVSTASSLRSVADRGGGVTPSPSPSPDRVGGGMAIQSVGVNGGIRVGDGSPAAAAERGSNRKSIGARNYFIMGGGGQQSRRVSRVVSGVGVVKSPSGGGGGTGGGGGSGSPQKKRQAGSMHHQRRSSAMLRMSRSEFTVGGEEGKENTAGGGGTDGEFKVGAAEFTFEVSNPNHGAEKGGLGLREGSSGSVNALVISQQKDSQRLSLAWKPAEGGASRNGSPVRLGGAASRASMRSVDNLSLYDRQGFLISASPVRGASPSGLRV